MLRDPKRRVGRQSIQNYRTLLRSRVGRAWKRTPKKDWAYAANSWRRGAPINDSGLCIPPPMGSKQGGEVCNSRSYCDGKMDPGYAHLRCEKLQSIAVDWRRLLLQLSPGFSNPGFVHYQQGMCAQVSTALYNECVGRPHGSQLETAPGRDRRSPGIREAVGDSQNGDCKRQSCRR